MGIPPVGDTPRASGLRAVLLDLDDTLFDHAHATRGALTTLAAVERVLTAWPFDELVRRHSGILETLHARVLRREISVDEARIERFRQLLEAAGSPRALARAEELAGVYRRAYEEDWRAVPGALALLEAIRREGWRAIIVTNNGVAEQRRKLERCGIGAWIDAMITSEEAGVSKPDPAIFEIALRTAGATADEVVMVGDAWPTDVAGALAAGIRPIWFNRHGQARPDPAIAEVRALEPLDEVLRWLRPAPSATGYENPRLPAVP